MENKTIYEQPINITNQFHSEENEIQKTKNSKNRSLIYASMMDAFRNVELMMMDDHHGFI